MTAMAEQRFTSKTSLLFSGLLIWAAHFMFVYSANAVACERGLQDFQVLGIGLIPLTVMVATLAALAAVGYVLLIAIGWLGPLHGEAHDDPSSAFVRQITIVLSLISIVAITLSALPSLVVSPCEGLPQLVQGR